MKNTSIITRKTGAGHYEVEVMKDLEIVGKFKTTDMDLIADISELNNNGFEQALGKFDSFEEVEEYCISECF